MKDQSRRLTRSFMSLALLAGLWTVATCYAEDDTMKHKNKDIVMPPGMTKEKMIQDMHKCMIGCSHMCQKQAQDVKAASDSLMAASQALDAGNIAAANAEIEKTQKAMSMVSQTNQAIMDMMPPANMCCPLSGNAFDVMNLPKNQIRMYKGLKIGFGSVKDAQAWDKLTAQEQEVKAKAVLPDYSDPYMYGG